MYAKKVIGAIAFCGLTVVGSVLSGCSHEDDQAGTATSAPPAPANAKPEAPAVNKQQQPMVTAGGGKVDTTPMAAPK